MAKTKEPKKPKGKPAEPAEVVVTYDLFDLPTAFHKAGLAGLVLLIESLKARHLLAKDGAEYEVSTTKVTVTFTKSLVQKLMDDVYDATKVERRYDKQKKDSKGKVRPEKRTEVVETETASGNKVRKTVYIYDETQPAGHFLRERYPDEDGLWLKLWREMLWEIPRGRATMREPYDQRADKQPCKEGPNAWADLLRSSEARRKNTFHTAEVSSALWPGAQAVNAEGVPFRGQAEQNLLLHFWPLTVLIFVPQQVEADGSAEFAGFTLAVPEVSNLKRFVRHYPNLLHGLSKNARGYRPAEAVVDLPAEGALAFLDHLAALTAAEVEQQQVRYSMNGVEYLHLHKPKGENNTKMMAAGRVAADDRLLARYHEIVAPNFAAGQPLYRNPLFRRGLLVALLDDVPWYRPFDRTFATFDADLFIRQPRRATNGGEEKGMPQFANDAAKKFRHETALFSSDLKRYQDMPEPDRAAMPRPQTPPAVIINRVVRNYLLTRTTDKTGIKLDKFETGDGDIDWKAVPPEFNVAKQKLAQSLFLEFRSRKEQAFVDHFAATFFSVTQRFAEPDRLELSDMLITKDRREDLKTLTLLALSANS